MYENGPIEEARRDALDRVDRTERDYRLVFFAAAVVESAFLAGYLLLADFSNRLHVLLLIASVAIYSIVALGLVALGAHVKRCTLRILKAIELSRGRS
jgi:hypothetical protein